MNVITFEIFSLTLLYLIFLTIFYYINNKIKDEKTKKISIIFGILFYVFFFFNYDLINYLGRNYESLDDNFFSYFIIFVLYWFGLIYGLTLLLIINDNKIKTFIQKFSLDKIGMTIFISLIIALIYFYIKIPLLSIHYDRYNEFKEIIKLLMLLICAILIPVTYKIINPKK